MATFSADFSAGKYLSRASGADVAFGDADWTIAGWFYVATLAAGTILIGKENNPDQDFAIYCDNIGGAFRMGLEIFTTTGTPFTAADSTLAVNAGEWYFVAAYRDQAANKVGVRVNARAAVETTTTGTMRSTASPFTLGRRAYSGAEGNLTGRIAAVGKWSRKLSGAELDDLYNAGNGSYFADLRTAQKVGMVAAWDLQEASGARADGTGRGNTLTDNGGVGQAAGIVGGPSVAPETTELPITADGDSTVQYPNDAANPGDGQSWTRYIKEDVEAAVDGVTVTTTNRAVSGQTSAQLLARLPDTLAANPAVYAFKGSLNDLAVSSVTIKATLREIFDRVLSHVLPNGKTTQLTLQTDNLAGENLSEAYARPYALQKAMALLFQSVFAEYASNPNVHIAPDQIFQAYDALGGTDNPDSVALFAKLLPDKVHPNKTAYDTIERSIAIAPIITAASRALVAGNGLVAGTLSAPTGQTSSSLTGIAWTASTAGVGSKTAKLQRSLPGLREWTDVAGAATTNAASGQSAGSLSAETSYDLSVLYTDADGQFVRSNIVQGTTAAAAPDSTITGVTASPTAKTLYPSVGGCRLTAAVAGTGDFDDSATWSKVVGGSPLTLYPQTDGSCIVLVDTGAAAGTYQIKATSVQDATKSATVTITVEAVPSGDGGAERPVWAPGEVTFLFSLLESCRRLEADGDEPLAVLVTAKEADGTPIPPRDFDAEIQITGFGQTSGVWHTATLTGSRFVLPVVGDSSALTTPLSASHNYTLMFRIKNAEGAVLQSQQVGITAVPDLIS